MPCPHIKPRRQDRRNKLREFLKRLESADCKCPLYLSCPCKQECPEERREECRHCREECDCQPLIHQPPCHHAQAPPDPADLFQLGEEYRAWFPRGRARTLPDMWAALLRKAFGDSYAGRKTPLPEVAAEQADIVNIMLMRQRQGFALWSPKDSWPKVMSFVGVRAARLRNGATTQKGVVRG